MRIRIHSAAAAVIVGLVLIAGCGNDTSSGSSDTTAAARATTTVSAPPTTPLPASSFVLRSDGLGPFDFGTSGTDVLDAISATYGAPVSDDVVEYPIPDPDPDDGEFDAWPFTTTDGSSGYSFPFGRTACFAPYLCIVLGGNDSADEVFTGWSLEASSERQLSAASGVTIGSNGADFPSMELIAPSGCVAPGLQDGFAFLDGIALTLISSGASFSGFDEAGAYVESIPALEDVEVVRMGAGGHPAPLVQNPNC